MRTIGITIGGLILFLLMGSCGTSTFQTPQNNLLPSSATPSSLPSIELPDPLTLTPIPSQTNQNPPSPTYTTSPIFPTSTSLPPAEFPCWSQGGYIEQGQLDTELLPQPLDYRVYIPPCYEELPGSYYPVLYLIHGQSYNDDQWERLGVGEMADGLISTGDLPPFLIVMPRDRSWQEPTKDNFGKAVIDVLIPWIDEKYRTLPERRYRAIGGLSRGGAWALTLALTNPDLFGGVGIHSGFVFHSDVPNIKSRIEDIPSSEMPRIYLDNADKDRPEILRSASWFEGFLTDYNIPHEWHLFSGYHEESYWKSHLEQYLRWYADKW
jgi:enterochelin esterase-like enzyme